MILVTGATGLIGSHLTAKLLLGGKDVCVFKRPDSNVANIREVLSFYTPDADNYFQKLEFRDGDVKDIFSISDALQGVDTVYHCAGMVSFEEKRLKEMLAVNAAGTANMVNACLESDVRLFCYVSSVATMPNHDKREVVDETVFWKSSPDNNAYAISKYNAEREVWRASEEGLRMVMVNPSVVIGPGCWGQSSGRLLEECYKGSSFYAEGITGFVDVRDVTECMIELVEKNIIGKRFVVNGENKSFKDVIWQLHAAFGKKQPSISAGKWMLKTGAFFEKIFSSEPRITKATIDAALSKNLFSNERIRKETGHKFIPIEDSLKYAAQKYIQYKSTR